MFSRSDPIQPQKVSRNMRTPTTISRMAGSTARQAKAASGGRTVSQSEPGADYEVGGCPPELFSSAGGIPSMVG